MEIRQLRSLAALEEAGFSVTAAAERLHLVQSAVSQHLQRLEDELGTELFQRRGKRLIGLTEAGRQVLFYARRTLADCDNILAVGREHVEEQSGLLRIATTHTQAVYILPRIIREFRQQYPAVRIEIHQGTPEQLLDMVRRDRVDFAICTEAIDEGTAITALGCYRWNRSVIAPRGHALFEAAPLSLATLCAYPMITYVFGLANRSRFRIAFARQGLSPDVVLSAVDTEVIKTYVRDGMGIGVIASLAWSADDAEDLACRDLSSLFPWEHTRIAYKADKYLRRYEDVFVSLLRTRVGDDGASLPATA